MTPPHAVGRHTPTNCPRGAVAPHPAGGARGRRHASCCPRPQPAPHPAPSCCGALKSGGEGRGTGDWLGLVGRNNEVAVAILSDGEPFAQGAIEVLLQELGPVLAGFYNGWFDQFKTPVPMTGAEVQSYAELWWAQAGVAVRGGQRKHHN